MVFARRSVHSDASRGRVNKLQYAYTGPWRVTAALKGASYELERCSTPNCKDKKHAYDLSPYPIELIPFQPVERSDTRYGQIHRPIKTSPFWEAGINGFKPFSPFRLTAQYLTTDTALPFHWPSLSELNDDIPEFQLMSEVERRAHLLGDSITAIPVMYTGPPPTAPTYPPPTVRLMVQSEQIILVPKSLLAQKGFPAKKCLP